MHSQTVLLALVAAVGAVPLNINLGAYSPALVVGDGEISLGAGGAAGASELMATLAQGAQQGAAGGGAAEGGAAGGAGGAGQGQQGAGAGQGEGAQEGGEAQPGAAQPGEAQPGEGAQPGGEQQQEQPAEGEAEKRGNLARSISELFKREAAPKPEPTADAHLDAVAAATEWIKRDLNSFNAALSFAREAQKDSPKVELGTGAEGSGVGITVNAGVNVPANSAANGAAAPGAAAERKVKRSEVIEESEAPKMTLVAITEV